MADREQEGASDRSGPMPLPEDMRARDPRWAWSVAFAVVVLGLLLYAATRPSRGSQVRLPAPPVWGNLTLVQIAKTQARVAGDARPKGAVWVGARSSDVLQLLTGAATGSAESDYVVDVTGRFRAEATGNWLPGSLPGGPHLILVIRAFDGTVQQRMITGDPGPDLGRLGPVQVLRLGWL